VTRLSVLSFLLFLSGAYPAMAQRVTGLFLYHSSGQTFMSWNSAGSGITSYTVYRSRKPLRTSLALNLAEQVYTVRPGQALDKRLTAILGRPTYFVFPGPAGKLSSGKECFVITTVQAATWYYAVTATDKNGEYRQVHPGRNAVASGVQERAREPHPVHQARLNWKGRTVEVYVHWTTNSGATDYPAMSNVVSYPFHFALRKNGRAALHPLHVRLHGRGDHFLDNLDGTGNPQEYILSLDDELPGSSRSSFWFGYSLGMDIFSKQLPSPPGAIVMDFTQRRIRWTLRWVLRTQPIDSTRVYFSGTSMGGSGALFYALSHPEDVAGVAVYVPRLRFHIRDTLEAPKGKGSMRAADALWGKPEYTPRMTDGRHVYDVLDAVQRFRDSDLRRFPHVRIIGGSRDSVVGWKQLAAVLRVSDSVRSGLTAFWDARDHDSRGEHVWDTQSDASPLFRYRTNRSWPAFSKLSISDIPSDSFVIGMLNAAADWFEPVIDIQDFWSVGIRRVSVDARDTVIVIDADLTATLTLRRLQRFRVRRGSLYRCELKDGDAILFTSIVPAARDGELSIDNLPIPERPATLEIRPVRQ